TYLRPKLAHKALRQLMSKSAFRTGAEVVEIHSNTTPNLFNILRMFGYDSSVDDAGNECSSSSEQRKMSNHISPGVAASLKMRLLRFCGFVLPSRPEDAKVSKSGPSVTPGWSRMVGAPARVRLGIFGISELIRLMVGRGDLGSGRRNEDGSLNGFVNLGGTTGG
ncbi:hypothetical protein FOZ63_008875, partial [Perkinsus olseni]